MTLVMKFGGTSVGSPDAIRSTTQLISDAYANHGRLVVVASALGTKPVKVTDLLLQGAASAVTGETHLFESLTTQLRQIHFDVIDALLKREEEITQVKQEIGGFIDRFHDLCWAISVLAELSPRAADAIGGMGEQMSVRILAAYLREQGLTAHAVDATELIVTDSHFQDATPLIAETNAQTRQQLLPLLADGIIPIVTGFIAANSDGVTTTLGRSGSDYSASILGRALEAEEVWIWTDVDGVMSADPRLVPTARTIPTLTYREVSELAYYGAKVLHPRTMRPVVESGIPLRIKNTFNPEHPGTQIVYELEEEVAGVRAVTAINALSIVTVEGKGMMGVPGVAARTFKAVAESRISVLMITQASSEQSICFVVPENASEQVIRALEHEFGEELAERDIDRIWALEPTAIITVVGAGMRGTPGIAGQLFSALGGAGINIIAIAQGSSECSISLVVESNDVELAVRKLHDQISNY